MSDASPADSPAGPEPSTSPAPQASQTSDSGAGGDPFDDLPADQPLFPRSYVEKLRTEGQKYRTEAQTAAQRAQEYDSVYGIYEPDDRQVWMDLARTWAVDPNRAAELMSTIARSVLDEGNGDGVGGSVPTADADTAEAIAEASDGRLTPDQVQAMIDEALAGQAQSAAEAQAIEDIYGEVRSHGFDPETREGFMVLWTANNETDGDIGAAVEKMKQYRQGIIDEYVAGRSGAKAIPAPGGGVPAAQSVGIESFDDARKATDAFLRAQGNAGA